MLLLFLLIAIFYYQKENQKINKKIKAFEEEHFLSKNKS